MTRSARRLMRTQHCVAQGNTTQQPSSNHSSSAWDYPAGMLVLPFYLYTSIVHPLPLVVQPNCKCAGLPHECMFSISFLPPFTRVCCSFSLVFVAPLASLINTTQVFAPLYLLFFLLYVSCSLLTSSTPKVLLFPPLSTFPLQYLLLITFLFVYPSIMQCKDLHYPSFVLLACFEQH